MSVMRDPFEYAGEVYCKACAEREASKQLNRRCDDPIFAGYDPVEFPVYCAAQKRCLNSFPIGSGVYSPALMGFDLTVDGAESIREQHRNNPTELTRRLIFEYDLNEE